MSNTRKLRSRLLGLVSVAMVTALFAGPAALAQDPTVDPSPAQFDKPIPGPEGRAAARGGGDSGDRGGGLGRNVGSLPFTGIDLMIVAGVAFILTGTGLALRRLSTPRAPRA